jgi:ribosome-associated protein
VRGSAAPVESWHRPSTGGSSLDLDTTETRRLAEAAARAAADKLATDIHILDIGNLLGITDFFVICSARNDRQLKRVVEEVQERLKKDEGVAPLRREGQAETGWMLLDYGSIVVHAFTEEQRRYYALERLWGDAPTTVFVDPVEEALAGATADGDA